MKTTTQTKEISTEEKLLNRAMYEFREKLRAIFQQPVQVEVNVYNIPLSKIVTIQENSLNEDAEILMVKGDDFRHSYQFYDVETPNGTACLHTHKVNNLPF